MVSSFSSLSLLCLQGSTSAELVLAASQTDSKNLSKVSLIAVPVIVVAIICLIVIGMKFGRTEVKIHQITFPIPQPIVKTTLISKQPANALPVALDNISTVTQEADKPGLFFSSKLREKALTGSLEVKNVPYSIPGISGTQRQWHMAMNSRVRFSHEFCLSSC